MRGRVAASSLTTHELSWQGQALGEFVALGNKVLFEAEDTSHKLGLWVTDGTSAGTSEITSSSFYFPGVFDEVSFSGVVIDNEVVFSGTDNLGNIGLWSTNGTEAGAKEVVYPTSVSNLRGSANHAASGAACAVLLAPVRPRPNPALLSAILACSRRTRPVASATRANALPMTQRPAPSISTHTQHRRQLARAGGHPDQPPDPERQRRVLRQLSRPGHCPAEFGGARTSASAHRRHHVLGAGADAGRPACGHGFEAGVEMHPFGAINRGVAEQ